MRLVVLAFAFAALAAPAVAGPAERSSFARLIDCRPGDRAATFQGEIRAFKGTAGLSLRFILQTRDLVGQDWRRVRAPGFGQRLRAKTGSPAYVYDKVVENLAPGADYRVVVRYLWRDEAGDVVAKEVKRSKACRLPDTRANLVPESLTVSAGSTQSTRTYALLVANRGRSVAPEFFVSVSDSDGKVVEDSTEAELAPEATVELRFEADACIPGSQLTATVDTEAEVDEASELDNVLSVACPSTSASKRPAASF